MTSHFSTSRIFHTVLLALAYILVLSFTHYAYLGDTMGYAQNVISFDRSPGANQKDLWDFGHLAWRPLAWILYRAFGSFVTFTKTGETTLTVAAMMIAMSAVSGLVAVMVFRDIALRFLHAWAASLVALTFLCFHAFLNYVHTGSSYIAGLALITFSFWFALKAGEEPDRARLYAVLSGVAAAGAILFWFPFIVPTFGLVVALYLWPTRANRFDLVRRMVLTAAAVTCAAYVVPLVALHITSAAALKEWIVASSHGWSQNKRLLRLASGLPRSFIWIGNEGTLIKRYLLHDPYSPVSVSQIIVQQLWRLAAFYLAVAALLFVLSRSQEGRRVLAIFAAGAAPVLLFAVLIFEPGSIERYLPIYPFLCLAMAFSLSQFERHRLTAGIVVGFLCITSAVNLLALCRSTVLEEHRGTEARALSLENKVSPRGLVAVDSLMDDLYQYSSFFPFEAVARKTKLPMYDVVIAANERSRFWRQDFAKRALQTMDQGEAVWVSKRVFAARPESSWGWNEGDDPNVRWTQLPEFFNRLNYSGDTGGADGFRRIADSPENRAILTQTMKG